MTLVCGGGASSAKSGFPSLVTMDAASILAFINSNASSLGFLLSFGGLLNTITYDLSTYCTTDPPALPSNSDIQTALVNIITGDPLTRLQAQLTLNNTVGRYLWPYFCQCTSGAAPTAPTAPSVTNVPSVNPNLGGVLGQPCWDATITELAANSTNWADAPTQKALVPYSTGYPAGTPVPTSITLSVSSDTAGADPASPILSVSWRGPTGSIISTVGAFSTGQSHCNAGATCTVTTTPPTGAASFVTTVSGVTSDSMIGTNSATMRFTMYCSGQNPSVPAGPCCPPDPILTGRLQQILDLVTLIQRQAVPFAYIGGAAHTGLSGNGNFAVSGILGLRVDLTTVPGRLGESSGDPVSLWDAGWINVGSADGFGPRLFISSNPMLVLPVSSAATVVGYSIPADVTATITELIRES